MQNEESLGQAALGSQAAEPEAVSCPEPSTGGVPIVAPAAAQAPLWANIPVGLRDRPQWVVAGPDKRPLTIDGRAASVTDPATWCSSETACEAAKAKGLYIGYVLAPDDPYAVIDLDVKDDTQQPVLDGFHSAIQSFDSYTERSCSGKGFHILIEGNIGKGRRRDSVEVYSQERYIICTGDVFLDRPIAPRPEQLAALLDSIPQSGSSEPLEDEPEREADEVILQRARAAANADKFHAHYFAHWDAIGHTDHSRADAALIGMLADYTANNAQLKRLFLGSALGQRDKATKRRDYVDRTIATVRAQQARGPNARHGERIAGAIFAAEYVKRQNGNRSTLPASRPFRLITEDEMANRPPVRWRVRDVLPEEGVVAVYGPPGSGKSFLVLDMLGAVSTGREWFGHRVRPAPVVYVALEGKAGVSQRVRAYRKKRGSMKQVRFLDEQMDLRRPDDRASIIDAVSRVGWTNGVVCIDTLAASAPGMDENASTDMGKVIAALKEIQDALGGCVMVVHHTGKDQSKGLRGWSGLTGAVDGAIEVSGTRGSRQWRITKAKDGEDGMVARFELEAVLLEMAEDGLPVTSCVITADAPEAADDESAEQVLKLIREYYERGEYISPAVNSPTRAYNVLKDDPQFPQALSKDTLTKLLREAERAGLLERETYGVGNRNTKERWKLTEPYRLPGE